MSKPANKAKTKAGKPASSRDVRNDDPQRHSQISAQVDADLRARLRPELRKLYDLYYTKDST